MKKHSFPKAERLKSKISIDALFKKKGKDVFVYPFKISYLPNREGEERQMPQILVSVPKRSFKLAVDRNKIKRRIKEAYRLQKSDWASQLEILPNCMSILYVGKKIEDYSFIERKMSKALLKLSESLTTQPTNSRSNKDTGDFNKESLV